MVGFSHGNSLKVSLGSHVLLEWNGHIGVQEVVGKTHLEVTFDETNLIISEDTILFIILVCNSLLVNGSSTILKNEWADLGELINSDIFEIKGLA